MASASRIDPIDRDIALLLSEELSPRAQSKTLAAFAQEQLKDAQDINEQALGRVPKHQTTVDGRAGADPSSVKPDGAIVYEFLLVNDAIDWIEQMLIQHSPELSGQYSRSHVLFADGALVQFGADVPEAREYMFVNTQPYARKIESGLSNQARSGVYEAVAVLASQRFANLARVRFTFTSLDAGAVHDWAGRTKTSKHRRGRAAQTRSESEWLRRQPAIIVATT